MLITAGSLELELIPNPKNWGWSRGHHEYLNKSGKLKSGWYLVVGPFRLEWSPLNRDA